MTSSKNTKRALLASVLSVLLCVAMLIGTTFAWFTDSVTSSGNKIIAGNLNIDLVHVGGAADGKDASLKATPTHKIFDYELWEPGYTAMETLKVVNNGSLALKFRLDIAVEDVTVGPKGEKLADVIDVYVYEGTGIPTTKSFAEMTAANGWRNAGTLSNLMADPDGVAHGELLKKDDNAQMTVALHMQETAGNEYQGLKLGDMSFTLRATQHTYEKDSFDDQYDKDAEYAVIKVTNSAELEEALRTATSGDIIRLEAGTYTASHPDNWRMVKNGVILKGAGMDKTILEAKENTGAMAAFLIGADNVTIQDLTIRTETTNKNVAALKVTDLAGRPSVDNVTIKNVALECTNGNGLNLSNVNGAIVDGVKINKAGKAGIALQGAKNVTITNTAIAVTGWKADIGCMKSKVYSTVTIGEGNNFNNGVVYSENVDATKALDTVKFTGTDAAQWGVGAMVGDQYKWIRG